MKRSKRTAIKFDTAINRTATMSIVGTAILCGGLVLGLFAIVLAVSSQDVTKALSTATTAKLVCNLESRTLIAYKSTAWEYSCAVSGIRTTYARTSSVGTIVETYSIPGCPSGYTPLATAWKTSGSLPKKYQCVYSCVPTGTSQQVDPTTGLRYYPSDGGLFVRLNQASPEDVKKVLLVRPLWQVNDVHYKEIRLGAWARYTFYQPEVIVYASTAINPGQIVGKPEQASTCK